MNFIDKLPTCLLEVVFKSMHYEQKKQCKLVCRLWNQILGSGLDVETITIRGKPEFCAFIESSQDISLACKSLMLCHYQPLPSIAKLFPNLRCFVFIPTDEYKYRHQNQVMHDKRAVESFLGWHQHLQVFINMQVYNGAYQFLDTGVFQKLTSLVLGHDRYTPKSRSHVISSLKNTPNLRILQLHWFQLCSHDLNILHTYVTRLHTLVLDHCSTIYLEPVNAPITPPVKSVKKLLVTNADTFILDNGELLKFMVSKYPNVKQLAITALQKDDAWKAIIPPIISIQNLVTLKVDTCTEIPNIINVLKENGTTYLKNLALNLLSNELLLCDVIKLVKSSNIGTLFLHDSPQVNLEVFKEIDKLKKLGLEISSKNVNSRYQDQLNTYSATFGETKMVIKDLPKSLETLWLSCPKLYIISEEDGEGNCYQSNLKSLMIYKTEIIGNSLLKLSRRHFPNLDQLILTQNNMKDLLSLPDQRFSLVKIIINGQYLMVTVGNGKTLYYAAPCNEPIYKAAHYQYSNYAMHSVLKPSPVIDANAEYLHFQCESVQNLLYNNYLLLV